jgi:hypothetical protein
LEKNWYAGWAANPAPPIKPNKSMALIKGKLKLGPGFGINLSEKGMSPYFTTPLGPVDAGVTCVPTTIKGVRFSIGGKNPADMFINALRQMGRPAKLPKPGIKLALTKTHTNLPT